LLAWLNGLKRLLAIQKEKEKPAKRKRQSGLVGEIFLLPASRSSVFSVLGTVSASFTS
jgi:hypothetical protein